MTRPRTLMEALFTSRWVARAGLRRGVCAVLALLLAILSIWPRPYLASALLAPDDSAAGLSGLFSGGGGANLISSLLGGRGTIEADLLIGRSNAVFATVARRLHDQGRYRETSLAEIQARLHRKVEIEATRGSILHISIKDHDRDLALQIVENFTLVLRQRLTTLSRAQANDKGGIVSGRMEDATHLLEQAQQALNAYRASHNFSTPEIQQAFSQGTQIELQAQLQAAQTALLTLGQTAGPDNVQLQTIRFRIQALQRQIAGIESRSAIGSVQSLAKVNPEVAEYRRLLRNEAYAQERYDIYKRYIESLTVQEVAAPLSIAVIDPPFIDPQRYYNYLPLGLLTLLLMFAIIAEFYLASPSGLVTADRPLRITSRDAPEPAAADAAAARL